MDQTDQTPTLSEVIEAAIQAYVSQVYSAIPGIVVSYDSVLQRVDVQPAVKTPDEDEQGNRTVVQEPVIPSVPVQFPGSGDYSITFPIKKGDPVLLVISSVPTDTWLALGGVVDPRARHIGHISDAFAIPGVRPRKNVIKPPPPTNAMVLAAPFLGKVKVGGATGTQPTLLATSFLSALDTLIAAIGSAIGATGAPDAAAAAGDVSTALLAFQNALVRDLYKTTKTEVL